MRITVDQKELKDAIALVKRTVATRGAIPQTSHIALRVEASRSKRRTLRLQSTNLEAATEITIVGTKAKAGEITLPARTFADTIASLPPGPVTIEAKGHTVTLAGATLSGMAGEDFPPIPTITDGPTLHLDAPSLRAAAVTVARSAATDESRPVLTGIYLERQSEGLSLTAADGFRITTRTIGVADSEGEWADVVISARAMLAVAKMIGTGKNAPENIDVQLNEAATQIKFRHSDNGAVITSQVIQGSFPSYTQLIPESCKTSATFEAKAMREVIKRAKPIALEGSGIVRFVFGPKHITISTHAEEQGTYTEDVPAKVSLHAEAKHIAASLRYLSDVLTDDGEVSMGINGQKDPMRFACADGSLSVVMPMFVQW